MRESILAAIHGEFGRRELPEIGTVIGDIYTVILCPVCNHKTLDNYDICRYCGWEYDGFPEYHYSAANGATMREYRDAYKKAVAAKKVFVGGSKSLSVLTQVERELLLTYVHDDCHILIGDCRGADFAIQNYLYSAGYSFVTVYATEGKARNNSGHWYVKAIDAPQDAKGFDYYRQKDIAMATEADEVLMFWDCKSKGTYHNLLDAVRNNKVTRVVLRPFEVMEITTVDDIEKIRQENVY